ncbi:hypothetical protein VKT23_016047 [Stygiomarasmius scandens]|uniref:Uncharacterized protein n=1 Tax=Marasmiellus scandens TaxID=2682957 RepID=A0ABR1IMV1_9AGAR
MSLNYTQQLSRRARNSSSTTSSETTLIVPVVDPLNPLYVPSIPAALYLSSLRENLLPLDAVDVDDGHDLKMKTRDRTHAHTLVEDSGIQKRQRAHIAKENRIRRVGSGTGSGPGKVKAKKKSPQDVLHVSSFTRSLGQVILQVEKEKIRRQKEVEKDRKTETKKKQDQDQDKQDKDKNGKTITASTIITTATADANVDARAHTLDSGDCHDYGTPLPPRPLPIAASGPRLRAGLRQRPIRKTRKDRAAAEAVAAATSSQVSSSTAAAAANVKHEGAVQTATFYPPPRPLPSDNNRVARTDFDFDFDCSMTSPLSLPPLPPLQDPELELSVELEKTMLSFSRSRDCHDYSIKVEEESHVSESELESPAGGPSSRQSLGLSPEIPVLDNSRAPARYEDDEDILGLELGSKFSPDLSFVLMANGVKEEEEEEEEETSSLMSPVVWVRDRARTRANAKSGAVLLTELEERKEDKERRRKPNTQVKRRLKDAFPELFGEVEAGAGGPGRRGSFLELPERINKEVSGYTQADRESEMMIRGVADYCDAGEEREEEEGDETLIKELEELKKEKVLMLGSNFIETGFEMDMGMNWREREKKRRRKTGFPPRSYPAYAGLRYSPLKENGEEKETAEEVDSMVSRVKELEDMLYGPPIGTETPRGYKSLAGRLDKMLPGLRLGRRLEQLDASSKTHQGIVDLLGREGLLNERILEVFRSSEIQKLGLGPSMADEGGLNLGAGGILGVLRKPNSFLFLTELDFRGTKLDDTDLRGLSAILKLSRLGLDYTGIGNEGVFNLVSLKQTLNYLSLKGNTDVDDDAVPGLIVLWRLVKLGLVDTGIGMCGLRRMARVIEEERRVVDVEIPGRCEEYIESIPTQYLVHPQPPLITIPAVCTRLSAGALKRNLEAHKAVNSNILASGTREEMKERLEGILKTREVDLVVWGMVYGN